VEAREKRKPIMPVRVSDAQRLQGCCSAYAYASALWWTRGLIVIGYALGVVALLTVIMWILRRGAAGESVWRE
jgi:hypothetical protein